MNGDLQNKFIQLAKQKEELIKQLKEINESIEPLMEEIGEGTLFQCEEGLVFKVSPWKGQFVVPKRFEYVRTKRIDESKGSLSQKEAKEGGFDLWNLKKD